MVKEKQGIKEEIEVPKGIEVKMENKALIVKGPNDVIKKILINPFVRLEVKEKKIVITTKKSTKREKKIVGTFIAHIKNMIKGVSEKHRYVLKICSGHFPMSVSVENNKLVIKNFLGEKIPRVVKIKEGSDVKVDGDQIIVESINKDLAGQTAADIEKITRRAGYDRRIFQDGCYIIMKDGKPIK